MGAIVSAIFFCAVCAIHATGADVFATDAIVKAIFLVVVVCAIHARGAVVYAIEAIVCVHSSTGYVYAIFLVNVCAIHATGVVVYAIYAMDGFVCVIRATDSSIHATRTVDFATGLFFCVSTSMGDASVIPAIARKRNFESHRQQ